ncbi:hypothetical protein Taro_033857 [Colocasia esculenta]|uniref:Uncharacterized protein n=1 Tax=Colocasia esculenta TaxID=4460 RepID=A0A843W190_COLES|nr:hypothetical protein [Colocasia esculenta]
MLTIREQTSAPANSNLEGSKGNELRERSPVGNPTPHRFDNGNKNNTTKLGRKNSGTKVNKLTTPKRKGGVTANTAQQHTVSTSVNVLRARHKTAQADGKTLVWTTHTSHNPISTSQWSGAPTGVLLLDHESRSPLLSE